MNAQNILFVIVAKVSQVFTKVKNALSDHSVLKKIAPIFLSGLLLFTVAPMTGPPFTYTTSNGYITITGYTGVSGNVIIPAAINTVPVSSIALNAFANLTILTNVTISSGIINIGSGAFHGCVNLTNIIIPATITNLGVNAFQGCTNLITVTIPGSVGNIADYAFQGCTSLSSLMISNGVLNIGPYAFQGCTNLINLIVPGSVTNLGNNAFQGCAALSGLMISNGVLNIGPYAFQGCTNLINITIPGSVTNIADYAFQGCINLAGIYFASNAPAADMSAFDTGSSLTLYYLPDTLGWDGFAAGTGLDCVLWNPLIQINGAGFGLQNNQFGFDITGTANIPIVVEAKNSTNSVWTPRMSLMLTNGGYHYSEPLQTNPSVYFYRISSP